MDLYVGVDLGGTTMQAAMAGANGRIVVERSVPTLSHEGPHGVLNRMAGLVHDLAVAAGQPPLACGVGVPGLLDLAAGKTKFLPNLPTNWRDFPMRETLAAQVGCPIHLLNDVRAATLGELMFGCGRQAGTMAFFAIGTGIGGGVVVDGKLRLGPLGAAGELGHQIILPDGPRCGCGNRGCLEAVAGGRAIARKAGDAVRSGRRTQLSAIPVEQITARDVAAAARLGDLVAQQVLTEAGAYLGIAVASLVNLFNPSMVVVGGGVSQVGDLLLEPIRRAVRERSLRSAAQAARITAAVLGRRSSSIGAVVQGIDLALDHLIEV